MYTRIIIDVMNMAYRVFEHKSDTPSALSKKLVYKKSICNFIRKIEELKQKYLDLNGEIFLLFDNPTSRIDLQKSFYFPSRKVIYPKYKETRQKESKEFYNSIDLIRYYYLIGEPSYKSIQMNSVEADDVVYPVLKMYCVNEPTLLVSNDLDWVRFISNSVHWLPEYSGQPRTPLDVEAKLGFYPTEMSITVYKSLFGDPSDNIPSIATENKENKDQFINLLKIIKTPNDLIYLACKDEVVRKYSVLEALRGDGEKQFRINLQLVSLIPIADKHIQSVTCKGRRSTVLKEAIELGIGLREKVEKFKFAGIKPPRSV